MKDKQYWENVSVNSMLMTERSILDYEKKLNNLYVALLNEIDRELSYCFKTFGKNNKILFSDLRSRLTDAQFKKFKKEIKVIIDDINISIITREFIDYAKKLYEKKTASLLDYIQFRIQYYIVSTSIKMYEENINILKDTYLASYYVDYYNYINGVQKEVEFIPATSQQITAASKAIQDNVATIDRINRSSKYLIDNMLKNIQQCIAMGYTVNKIVDSVNKIIHTRYNHDKSNIRTSNAFVNNQANLDMMKNTNVDEYIYIAVLDERTTEECKSLNGKVFKLSEARIGVNVPPIHFNCRSSITVNITNNLEKTLSDLPTSSRHNIINNWLKNKLPEEQQYILEYIKNYYK